MSASSFPGLAIPKGTPRRLVKSRASRQQAAADKLVYAHVDARDGLRCRICGIYAGVDAHRHHLRGRRFTTIHDVCNLCQDDHEALHVRVGGKLMKLSGDAEARDKFGRLCGLVLDVRQNDGTWRREEGL